MELNEPEITHNRPEYVKRPVKAGTGYWYLGNVVPNSNGFTPGGVYDGNDYVGACHFCVDEAAERGVSPEAYEAAVTSSMGVNTFDKILESILQSRRRNLEKEAAIQDGPA